MLLNLEHKDLARLAGGETRTHLSLPPQGQEDTHSSHSPLLVRTTGATSIHNRMALPPVILHGVAGGSSKSLFSYKTIWPGERLRWVLLIG